MGSKFGAEQQTPTDSRSSKCSARRPLRARSTSPDRASLRSAGTKPESTAPFRRRPCASRASSRPTGLDRAPFAPGRPEKGILAPRRPPTTPGLANAPDSAPLAASTATVLEASACPSYKFRPAQKSGPFRVVPDSVCDPHTILLHGVLSAFAVAPCDSLRSPRLVINGTSFGATSQASGWDTQNTRVSAPDGVNRRDSARSA